MSLILERLLEDEEDYFEENESDWRNIIFQLLFEEDEEEVLYLTEENIDEVFKKKPVDKDEELPFDTHENPFEDIEKDTKKTKEGSAVNHPSHYNQTFLETMEKFLLIYADKPDYIKGAMLFNIIKYTDRAGHKDEKKQDEEKAEFYLNVLKDLFPEDTLFYEKYRSNKK